MFGADRLTKDVRSSERHQASSGIRSRNQQMRFGDDDTMTLYGSTVDKITSLARWPQDPPNLNTWLQELTALIQTSAIYGTLEQKKEAVFRTSCADFMTGPYMHPRPAQASDRTFFDILHDHVNEYEPTGGETEEPIEGSHIGDESPVRFLLPEQQPYEDEKLWKDIINYTVSIGCAEKSWRVYLTQKGYLGLGPATAQVGDLICIFATASTPHVLRAIDVGSDRYVLVGETYVHGIMKGQIETSGLETFTLV